MTARNLFKANLLFIFIFLNIWDFIVSRQLFNAMVFGIFMFGPISFLWYVGRFRAIALITFISIFEFLAMATFVLEGFELSGFSYSPKSIFWLPFLLMTGLNGFWGLRIYSDVKNKRLHHKK